MKVVFCTPTIKKPYPEYLDALEASIPLLSDWDEGSTFEVGCPYISHARSSMLRRAMDADADVVVFIDHDLSWKPADLLTLLETEGDVVAGTYRFKKDEVEYMGSWLCDEDGRPQLRADGCIRADMVPAGFLKVTRHAVAKFMLKYPELIYGDPLNPSVDLFNHGAWGNVWWGEDYAFSRRWRAIDDIWLVPNLDLCHHGDKPYPGNLHEYLLRQPGGSLGASEA